MVTGKWVNSDADDELDIPVDDGFFLREKRLVSPAKVQKKIEETLNNTANRCIK